MLKWKQQGMIPKTMTKTALHSPCKLNIPAHENIILKRWGYFFFFKQQCLLIHVCLQWMCYPSQGVKFKFEILPQQTAINAQSLPESTTVNNRSVSVKWISNQSWGCVHFNTLSREVYGFLFWHIGVANNGRIPLCLLWKCPNISLDKYIPF